MKKLYEDSFKKAITPSEIENFFKIAAKILDLGDYNSINEGKKLRCRCLVSSLLSIHALTRLIKQDLYRVEMTNFLHLENLLDSFNIFFEILSLEEDPTTTGRLEVNAKVFPLNNFFAPFRHTRNALAHGYLIIMNDKEVHVNLMRHEKFQIKILII